MIHTDGTPTIANRRSEPLIRLEELRAELRAERISYGELAELANLVPYIDPGDVELLEAAGVPEHKDTPKSCPACGGISFEKRGQRRVYAPLDAEGNEDGWNEGEIDFDQDAEGNDLVYCISCDSNV